MADNTFRQSIFERLANWRGLDSLKDLFWSQLNYERVNQTIARSGWPKAAGEALAESPLVFAEAGEGGQFKILYARLAADRLRLTDERAVVNRLLRDYPYALFIFSDKDQRRWHLVNVKDAPRLAQQDEDRRPRLLFRRIALGPEERVRTAAERLTMLDVATIQRDLFGLPPLAIQKAHDEAFDVEAVTRDFFTHYAEVFAQAESKIKGVGSAERKRLFTQRLFNRLMFIAFIQKKGWLTFNGDADYLLALWRDYQSDKDPDKNFYRDRLYSLFFFGLNTPHEQNLVAINRGGDFLSARIGRVPYLNGGLFEEAEGDREAQVPDAALAPILTDLFYRFNFTITESTPFDVEVAVDPEMLGKIFEELVTGRHESGSYYTPKPVVSFMCREALKRHLLTHNPRESAEALTRFVEDHDPAGLRDPEAALAALRAAKACDPACGSGAYLLGLLHELLDLRAALFAARQLDAHTVYERKLEIIQRNLYGVDKDEFAVNIARLRLWLSLAVDYEGDDPPPLPNLDFKIETGDSLTAPDPSDLLKADMFRQAQLQEFYALKEQYLTAHHGEKLELKKRIETLRAEIADWAHPKAKGQKDAPTGFDWAVEFAEVFSPDQAPGTVTGALTGIVNATHGQMEFAEQPAGGFDIVLANPPYVRMELFKDQKPILRKNFADVHDERADLYVYFYARSHELLRLGGVACFISSNKWLRANYGEKLRQHLLDAQAFHLVVDFGELPVFQTAATFPAIFAWQKHNRNETPTTWAVVKDLQACYDEGVYQHITRIAERVPAAQFGKGRARLASPTVADRRAKMEANGPTLAKLVNGQILRGVVTGLNEAFIIDREARDRLLEADSKSAEVIKPLLVGDDVRRYEIHFRDSYLLYMNHGVDIRRYPAIQKHLKPFRERLEQRATQQEWYELQQPQAAYVPFFEKPKIIFPDIGKETRFCLDERCFFSANTTYFLAQSDWYLLGILNSNTTFEYMKGTSSVLGDEEQGGRLRFFGQFIETLPIPDANANERKAVADLAKQAQKLHSQRRNRVEKFLRELGLSPAQSSSRNPLERPWALTAEEFARKAKGQPARLYTTARDETMALTEEIAKVENEIDARVAALYGVN